MASVCKIRAAMIELLKVTQWPHGYILSVRFQIELTCRPDTTLTVPNEYKWRMSTGEFLTNIPSREE